LLVMVGPCPPVVVQPTQSIMSKLFHRGYHPAEHRDRVAVGTPDAALAFSCTGLACRTARLDIG
jgi:hypothetical protein